MKLIFNLIKSNKVKSIALVLSIIISIMIHNYEYTYTKYPVYGVIQEKMSINEDSNIDLMVSDNKKTYIIYVGKYKLINSSEHIGKNDKGELVYSEIDSGYIALFTILIKALIVIFILAHFDDGATWVGWGFKDIRIETAEKNIKKITKSNGDILYIYKNKILYKNSYDNFYAPTYLDEYFNNKNILDDYITEEEKRGSKVKEIIRILEED